MSTSSKPTRRLTVPEIRARKGKEKIVALTAYSRVIAEIVDEFVDIAMVGDSTAMVAYGLANTLNFTLEQMIQHASAVTRSTTRSCVVVDLPFGSYQESPQQAFHNAARLIAESGADAVKLEGGLSMVATVKFLVERGIPVMVHIGLMPTFVNVMGGFRAQGMNQASAETITATALAMEEAGAFSIVLEGVAEPVARDITARVSVPTIGIGASPACDGQVLVTEDILGLGGSFVPRFAKQYAKVDALIRSAVEQYASEVKAGTFPEHRHCFGVK